MSYKTYNLIVSIENDRESLLLKLTEKLKYHYVQEFFTPFNGIVCQMNDALSQISFDKFNDTNIKDEEDVVNLVEERLKEYSFILSKEKPEKKVAFITVDCFGGKCVSDGFVLQNGNVIYENDVDASAHVKILKQVYPAFSTWHFYPFTRDFYSRKAGVIGGIVGDVINFSLPAIWMSFDTQVGSNPEYRIVITKNELVVEKNNFFELYFMVINDTWIKIMGRIFNDREENLLELEDFIKEHLEGLEYKVQLDLFPNGYQRKLSSLPEDVSDNLAIKSYRENSFNDTPFVFQKANSEEVDLDRKEEQAPVQSNFFKRIFKTWFGS